jgi:hypothetical protein
VYAPPANLAPPQPFPLVVAQSVTGEFVAPGVSRADVRLRTSAGPLAVHIVAVDTTEPTVRLGVVLSHDRLISSGETVSSMAARTGAVAGVNADYFDIGNTNQPLNIVVQGGALVRSPSSRVALFVGKDKRVHFGTASLRGTVAYGDAEVPLTGVNIWPPQGGVSLLTPAYGALAARPAVTTVGIAPDASAADAFRVTGVLMPAAAPLDVPALAFGPAAAAVAAPPAPGTPLELSMTLDPALADIAEAAGGGPLLVAGSLRVTDPNEPAPEEHDIRFPVSAAGLTADATLLLVAVDGRLPDESIGLTRPELSALMLGLGAVDAMAFDSGGSATLVARLLGDSRASVLNAPSDGIERPVADGVFVYSDAPVGAQPRLFARPAETLALPGAPLPLQGATVDAAGHRLQPEPLAPLVADAEPGEHDKTVHDGAGSAVVRYRTVDRIARLAIEPLRPNPDPGAAVTLDARGFDALGNAVALAGVRWTASGGTIAASGATAVFRAGTANGSVAAAAGGATDRIAIPVGRRTEALPIFGPEAAARWQFATVPKGAAGALSFASPAPADADDGVLTLPYDLDAERAASAAGDFELPGAPLAFGIDAFGDASGVGLRASFVNGLGERRALTLAKRVDWDGWRRLTIVLPPDLNPPVKLALLYVVRLGEAPLRTKGAIRWRRPAVTLPGSP